MKFLKSASIVAILSAALIAIPLASGVGKDGVVTLTNPIEGQVVSGTITVTATATNNPGWVELYVDGVLLCHKGGIPYACTYDTTKVPDGNHTFKALAHWNQANRSDENVAVVSNGTPPPPPAPPPPPPPPPPPGDLYVDVNTGNDSNPGTQALPFRTIQHAADVVNSGQTVIVMPGIYQESGNSAHCAGSPSVICIWRSGSYVFRSATKWAAVVFGGELLPNGFAFDTGTANVTLDGFDVSGLRYVSNSVSGVELFKGGDGSTIENLNLHDIGQAMTMTSNGQVGVFTTRNGVHILSNYMHDIGRIGTSVNLDHGIYLNDGDNDVISGNYFSGFTNGWGIQLYPGGSSGNGNETGTSITNNTFVGGKPDHTYTHIILGTDLTSFSFNGNVFWSANPSVTMTDYRGNFSGVTFSNNTSTGYRWCDLSVCNTSGSLPTGFSGTGNVLNAQIPMPPPPS